MGDRRIAVGDQVCHCLHDGTFTMGQIPPQEELPKDQSIPKILDRKEEDLAGDPFYKSILVKLLPNDNAVVGIPKNLTVIDRHLKVGQLVKRGVDIGYVRRIEQTASARIYHPDDTVRNDPSRELYIYKKPADFFGPRPWKIDDTVHLNGWLGEVTEVVNLVTFEVNFPTGNLSARAKDQELFFAQQKALMSPVDRKAKRLEPAFDINGARGFFPERRFSIPYNLLTKTGLTWIASAESSTVTKPSNDSTIPVICTVKTVALHTIGVDWKSKVSEAVAADSTPGKNVKNDVDRFALRLVSHADGLKVGDIGICAMNEDEWSKAMGKWTWQNTIAKDYCLHRKRDKRPRLDEGNREILPQKPYPEQVSVEIVLTTTKVDVEWINRTPETAIETNIDSRFLVPVRYKSYFRGAIVKGRGQHPVVFNGLGPLNTIVQRYSVVQDIDLIKVKPTYGNEQGIQHRLTLQVYSLQPGALEPVAEGQPTRTARKTLRQGRPIMQRFNLWEHNNCRVVTKVPNSLANFEYGCVIGMHPNGRIGLRRQDGEIISVWPTDVVGISVPPTNDAVGGVWDNDDDDFMGFGMDDDEDLLV